MADSASNLTFNHSSIHPVGAGNTTLPRLPLHEIRRPRLLALMQQSPSARIWTIVAPAGFGKSVLATQWAATFDFPVAWYSLRDNDNQPTQFLNYLLLSIGRALGHSLTVSIDPRAPLSENLTRTLEAIAALNHNLAIVFDDAHAVENEEIVRGIEQLFNQMPANLSVLVTSRTEPRPALTRQRANGQVIDIREQMLAFNTDESTAFLNAGAGIKLAAPQLDRLATASEGWITGLSLFKLSLKSAEPQAIDRLLERFEHGSGLIGSYLLEEVIRPLGPELRDFMIRASVLEYLDPALCNAALEIESSWRLVRELERQNLFIVSHTESDAPPRFHHLFGESLRALLQEEQSRQSIREIHQRAARYLEANGQLEGAARHAIAAEDWDLAVAILNRLCADIFAAEKTETLWYWLKQLPTEGLLAAGQLASWLAWSLSVTGKRAEVLSILDAVEPAWRATGQWPLVGEAALARGYLAHFNCDEPAFLAGSIEAVELIPDTDIIRKIQAWGYRNLALRNIGDREGASRARQEAHALVRKLPPDQTWWYASAEYIEPAWMAIEGKLSEAIAYGNHLFTLVSSPTSRDGLTFRGWNAVMHLERNELAQSEAIAAELVQLPIAYWNPARFYVILSRIAWARGQRQLGMELLETSLEHGRRENHLVNVKSSEALRAWYWTDQGDLFLAQRWESVNSLEDVHWMRMFNHFHGGLTIARLAIETGNPARASRVCRELLDESARRQRWGEMVRLHVLNAVAQHMLGDTDGALSSLSWAIRLGHEGRFIRSFLDDGERIVSYLAQPNLIALAPDYVREIHRLMTTRPSIAKAAPELETEPNRLTEREIDILRLVAEGLSNQVIAERLFIAEPTVRKHLNNIFRKLGVVNRTQAVNRARQSQIL